MQTQCPHCETRFRATESQVKAADGFVRCSVCKKVFNAFEVAEQHEHQPSLLSSETRHEDQQDDESQHLTIDPAGEATPDDVTSNEFKFAAPDNTKLEDDNQEQAENDTEQDNIYQETTAADKAEPIDFNKTSATDESRKDAFDFFDEEDNESLSHVVPEQFRQTSASNANNFLSTLLWGIGTLLLSATLVVEYVWFNRDQLNQIPQLQTWTEKLCRHIECKDITMRNPKKIELISRNVYSHPNQKNALMVNITMKNEADFAQPYPVMQIKFSDVRGGNIAARRFLPSEYLPVETLQQTSPQMQLFEPDTNMTFTMEIQDPGKQAMTYEFDFL